MAEPHDFVTRTTKGDGLSDDKPFQARNTIVVSNESIRSIKESGKKTCLYRPQTGRTWNLTMATRTTNCIYCSRENLPADPGGNLVHVQGITVHQAWLPRCDVMPQQGQPRTPPGMPFRVLFRTMSRSIGRTSVANVPMACVGFLSEAPSGRTGPTIQRLTTTPPQYFRAPGR